MMVEGIRAEQDGAILRIWLDRSDQENRVSDPMAVELTRLLDNAGDHSACVVLRGVGPTFCIGWGNYGELPPQGSVEAYERLKKYDIVFDCYSAFRRCRVPVVGIVQGLASGFGCAIAALCDITIASDRATFQVPEISHRILPTMVMSALVDRVPFKAITYLVASGREINAQRALTWGIISEIAPAAELEAAADEMCAFMLNAPRPALLGLKEYMRSASGRDIQSSVDLARNLHATVNTSSEMRKRR